MPGTQGTYLVSVKLVNGDVAGLDVYEESDGAGNLGTLVGTLALQPTLSPEDRHRAAFHLADIIERRSGVPS